MRFLRNVLTLIILLNCTISNGQATIEFRISAVSSTLGNMDGAFGSSDPIWCYEILDNTFGRLGQGNVQYTNTNCIGTRTPNDVFFSETYNCSAPASYRFRWRARENDGLTAGNVNTTTGDAVTALQTINIPGANIILPQAAWTTIGNYTATAGGTTCSGVAVTWTIRLQYRTVFSSFLGQGNDAICNAINLGTLNSNTTIGNNTLSNFNNYCSGNFGDPNPWGGNNNQAVWFRFTTGANPSYEINIDSNSDPQNFGDSIDLQLALYESSNGFCTGALTLVAENYTGNGSFYDESISVNCLQPNTTYFLLVDGQNTPIINLNGVEGYFGLQIEDNGIQQAADLICDAEFLGMVPDGGSIGTPLLSRTNNCASNTGDPLNTNFNVDKGVWFQFQAPTSGNVNIEVNSDLPYPLGTDNVDLQIVVYGTTNGLGNCTDALQEISSIYSTVDYNESLAINCLDAGAFYWVLVDGSAVNDSGIFDINISDSTLKDINTWNGTNWSRGVPTKYQHVIINADYSTALNGNIEACELTVNSGFTATINANNYFNVQGNLNINGDIVVENDGSLVQINDNAVNTGNILYERNVNIRRLDYVFWSSPINGFNIDDLSPLSPSSTIFKWDSAIANSNGGLGNWVSATGDIMLEGKGYIIRAPSGFDNNTPQQFTGNFTNGTPNNGIITVPISRGNFTGLDYTGTNGTTITRYDDNWNLIGNPYPSAIDVLDFLTLNTNIEGSVRIWTHETSPNTGISSPFYGQFVSNYTPSDFITYNGLGTISGPVGFNGKIAGGQGFMINMLDGLAITENIVFNNSMRFKNYDNSQFYKTTNSNDNLIDRIWLDIVDSNNLSDRTLIGYIEGATNQKDRLFDAVSGTLNDFKIYSLLDSDRMIIQGREFPFIENDEVKIGYIVPNQGNYKVAIAALDGIFAENQIIYLEDKELNLVYNITENPYSFSSESGEFKDRFVLKYINSNLNNDLFSSTNADYIIDSSQNITVKSLNGNTIQEVTIYNALGQLIFSDNNINNKFFEVNSIFKNNILLIIKIKNQKGNIISRKIIY